MMCSLFELSGGCYIIGNWLQAYRICTNKMFLNLCNTNGEQKIFFCTLQYLLPVNYVDK